VQEIAGEVDIHTGRERIAMHGKAQRKHSVLTFPPHHQGIPLGARRAEGKILIHLRQSAPEVEKRWQRASVWPTELWREQCRENMVSGRTLDSAGQIDDAIRTPFLVTREQLRLNCLQGFSAGSRR
jgi:hypothetical protein